MISRVAMKFTTLWMIKEIVFQNMLELKKAVPGEFVQIWQDEIAADHNTNRGHLLRLNSDL
jgi:hypothetical protein